METQMIYKAITNIMGDIGAIGKNKESTFGDKFRYRGIDDVMNVLKPLLAKHKVFIVPEVLEQTREERVTAKGKQMIYSVIKVKHTYYAEDGSHIASVVIGEGMDTGDKASNKALAIALKYSMFQVFCIPTEEMTDPDAECHEESHKVTGENYINDMMIKTLEAESKRTGYTEKQIAGMCKVASFSEIKIKYYKALMDAIKKYPNKEDNNGH